MTDQDPVTDQEPLELPADQLQPATATQPGSDPVASTGDPGVDKILAGLGSIDPEASPAEVLPILTQVHDTLAERLRAAEG